MKNAYNKQKIVKKIITTLVVVLFLFSCFHLVRGAESKTSKINQNTNANINTNTNTDTGQELSDEEKRALIELNQEIKNKKDEIKELERKSAIYEKNLAETQKEITTLKGELMLIDNQTELTSLDIQKTEAQIEKLNLEIESLRLEIKERKDEIRDQKDKLKEFIREIYKNSKKTYLEITIANSNFSDFFNQAKYLKNIEVRLKEDLDRFEELKHELEIKEEDLEGLKYDLEQKKEALEFKHKTLEEQRVYKDTLLKQTQSSENKYQLLLEDIKSEADRINSEIASLERRAREKLAKEGKNRINLLGSVSLSWPVNPSKGISAYFHDPTYPFRCTKKGQRNCIGEHPGIDIPTSQGTPVAAAEDGYVAIARKLDWITDEYGNVIRPAYNYVTLIHGEGVSTVYGHLSAVYVVEETFVKKGDIIGLSGGLPGTAGAGVWTTGAHLHFEVRVGGIPDDPLKYLP